MPICLTLKDACLEWHAWYEDLDGKMWHIDMIHIVKGSRYDGYFEVVSDRILAVLTEEQRNTILRLKFETQTMRRSWVLNITAQSSPGG